MSFPFKVGFGYDVHALERGRKLFLGGINIPSEFGLKGHSDADVLLHALCDALLGAAALGDIGKHFPDTDNSFKDIDSKLLLQQVKTVLDKNGYSVGNADMTLVLQKPKIAPYIEQMTEVIAGILEIDKSCISIKATTAEKLGFVGREEGSEAFAIAILYKKENS